MFLSTGVFYVRFASPTDSYKHVYIHQRLFPLHRVSKLFYAYKSFRRIEIAHSMVCNNKTTPSKRKLDIITVHIICNHSSDNFFLTTSRTCRDAFGCLYNESIKKRNVVKASLETLARMFACGLGRFDSDRILNSVKGKDRVVGQGWLLCTSCSVCAMCICLCSMCIVHHTCVCVCVYRLIAREPTYGKHLQQRLNPALIW